MEQVQDLLSDLEELLEERDEFQQMFDDETEAGNAEEADKYAEDLASLATRIYGAKTYLDQLIRNL